jgi:hypothetical protein
MTLDFTKTATPCELIRALIPLISGNLWCDARRWYGRQHDGQWKTGHQRWAHLILIHDARHQLPPDPRWDRFRELLGRTYGQYQALRWLDVARSTGYLPRPDDFPFRDLWESGTSKACLCFQDCWKP